MRTTIKALEAAMLDVAKATNRFTLDEIKDLTNEIDTYQKPGIRKVARIQYKI